MDYPEHEKVKALYREIEAIREFMEWLKEEKEVTLARWDETDVEEGGLHVVNYHITDLLEEFFGIDPAKIEAEKQEMLDEIRKERE